MRHLSITSLHNLFDKLHLKNKWSQLSMQLLQNAHRISPCTPHYKSLSEVDILFLIASQVTKACLGMAVENQISFHQLTSDNSIEFDSRFLSWCKSPLSRNPIGLPTSPMSTRGSLLCIETRELDLCGLQTQLFSFNTLETFASKTTCNIIYYSVTIPSVKNIIRMPPFQPQENISFHPPTDLINCLVNSLSLRSFLHPQEHF